jgi:N-methylhydantoinase A/oxoprolinase/acetone carboxylase beta subunit
MGGTSTDVSRYDGVFEHIYNNEISGFFFFFLLKIIRIHYSSSTIRY